MHLRVNTNLKAERDGAMFSAKWIDLILAAHYPKPNAKSEYPASTGSAAIPGGTTIVRNS
jgi:hypothetical protein